MGGLGKLNQIPKKIKSIIKIISKPMLTADMNELKTKQRFSRSIGFALLLNGFFFFVYFIEYGFVLYGTLWSMLMIIIGLDILNDINRINMWIYLRTKNGDI